MKTHAEYNRDWKKRNPNADKEYYAKNKEHIKERTKLWAQRNPDKVREYSRRKVIKNKEQRKVYGVKYRIRNRERLCAKLSKWRKDNPDKHLMCQMARRARKRLATIGDLTDIVKKYERARWWRRWFDVVVDHIVPLSGGGTHEASNLQIIYAFENAIKGCRMDYKPRVVFT